jgi:DNA helicase-2/ATP-dependent DNA helicase PcrA
MTIHLAKGLEFPHVFVVGMEEDLFPSAMSMSTIRTRGRTPLVSWLEAEHPRILPIQSRYRWKTNR